MRTKMSSKGEIGGMPINMALPTMVMVMDIAITEVHPNGDISYNAVISSVDVEAGEDDLAAMVNAMKGAMRSMIGTKVSAVITDRGETKKAEFSVPEDANPMSVQMMDAFKQTANQVCTPLPDQPVGKGAKWEIVATINDAGMTMKQTTTMSIKELASDGFTADVDLKQAADKQDIKLPQMPPGYKVELVNFKGSAGGEIKATTSSILPVSSTMNISSDQEIKVSDGTGESQVMKQSTKIELSLTSGPTQKQETPAAPTAK
jgi:hypothetical protein